MEDKYYLKIGKASDLSNPAERRLYRFFEMLTGLISLTIILLAFLLSWRFPVFISFFIMLYDVYWLFRTIYFAFYLKSGYSQMKDNETINWINRLEKLGKPLNGLNVNSWKDIYQLVILPMYKEPLEVVEATFSCLLKSDYPKDKMIVVLACEEADKHNAQIIADNIKKRYDGKFFKLLITFHPKDIEGEIAGHGSNDAWACKKAKETIIDPLKIPHESIIVSSLDIDACVYAKYFSRLTHAYLTVSEPLRTSYQPIPLYLNNVWQTPPLSRVFSFSSTFWHTMSQERPEKLVTFSSHSMSFKALNDVGFKQVNVVSDDSRIFWQCFFEYDGDYKVEPLYFPISMDVNSAETFLGTMKNVYRQQERWAYGVGEVPYFLFASIKDKKIPLKAKISMGLDLVEGHLSWALSSILIFILGWLPIFLGGREFSQTLISYNLPKITSMILTITMTSLVMSVWISMMLLPPKPVNYGRYKYVLIALEWLLIPFVMIFFSSLPALQAQMRWLTGNYMGFWVTPKTRKNNP